jgi:hypothetical protein
MRYAVVACSRCRKPWAAELRHATVRCPACQEPAEPARKTRLWEGEDPAEAQRAVAHHRAALAGGAQAVAALLSTRPAPRHDSPEEAAAARALGIANKSQRAELVALWMTRLVGATPHDRLVAALEHAGIERRRAEAEVVRMLAMDILMEPRAGHYKVLDG